MSTYPESKVIQAFTEKHIELTDPELRNAVLSVIAKLNSGALRVCEPNSKTLSGWTHHTWAQAAVSLYLRLTNASFNTSPWPHVDKVPAKFHMQESFPKDSRLVPPAYVRYGAHIGSNTVLMPCFVNIGAFVDNGTMLDTWCTVGSCAQIGKRVHLSGGAGIGGVLEPATAKPTIIEDDCFIGARSEIAEGVRVRKGAVLASGVFLTQSTKIYDRTTGKIFTGEVPENAVVVPGSLPSKDGTHHIQAAIIVKYADNQTRGKTALNNWLRDYKPPL